MTRKDYKVITSILKLVHKIVDDDTFDKILGIFVDRLQEDNSSFRADMFIKELK